MLVRKSTLHLGFHDIYAYTECKNGRLLVNTIGHDFLLEQSVLMLVIVDSYLRLFYTIKHPGTSIKWADDG